MDFKMSDSAYSYRGLKLRDPAMRGWDVFALQTALQANHYPLTEHGADGILGAETAGQIVAFQEQHKLIPDGIAGVITQRALAARLASRAEGKHDLPRRLLYGQLEHESSFWLGNYSALRSDGSRDCGVAQRNDAYTDHRHGFNAGLSIEALGEHTQNRYRAYRELGVGEQRAHELAAGSWNAPAWADEVAKGQATLDDYPKLAAYIEAVTVYVAW